MESTTATPEPSFRDTTEIFKFSWVDYCVFSVMLMFSTAIGIYYGFFEKKKGADNMDESEGSDHLRRASKGLEYLTGGSRDLKPFPVAMSLVASYISGVTVLGTPAEVYFFGTQYWIILLGIACMGVTVAFVYLPVFLQLQISSSYQYLELRFNSAVRTAACVLFIIDELLFLPIVLYVPSLAFNQVTGVGIHLIGSIVCAVCIFYTSVGGLKAVVWTDTLQILLMFFSVILVVVIGTINIGGVAEVWKRASDGGRLQLWKSWSSLPVLTLTPWSVTHSGAW